MSRQLDEIFVHQTSATECEIDSYSDLLDRVVSSCPEANVVPESQQWSRIAAIQTGATIFDSEELKGEGLPFNPREVGGVQVTYYRNVERWDLAWVAVWPCQG